jgi:outer membrane protein TolC
MKRVLVVTGLFALLGVGPTPLTFADAVQRVMTDGFDYRLAVTMAAAADAGARSKAAPTRSSLAVAGTAVDENLPQLGMPVSRQVYVSATASVPILAPAAVAAARAARYLAAGAGPTGDLANARDDAALAAARAYRRAQLGQAILEARHTAVDDQRQHVEQTDQQIAAGRTPRYLAARDRAQLALADQAEEDAAAERDEALNDLATLLALPVDTPIALVEPLGPIEFTADRDAYLKRALLQRADVAAAHARRLAAEQTVTAYRAAFSPTLALNAQSYNGASTPYLGHGGASISLNASLPIVDGGSRHADIADAAAQLDQARITDTRTQAYAERDVADAWRELQAARDNVARSEATLHNADEQLRVARLRERAGKAIDLEVLDALALTASAREERARSIARFDVAVAVLRRAAGDAQT